MDNTWDIAQDCEEDIDQKVGIAATLEEDTNWWQKDGENDFANVTIATKRVNSCSIDGAHSKTRHAALRLKWLLPCQ